jgi:ABC-type dipeptide/oligopeptide/nickel transport system ATPase component
MLLLNGGETVAIVGESGSGKTAGALSILRLIPDPPRRITAGAKHRRSALRCRQRRFDRLFPALRAIC